MVNAVFDALCVALCKEFPGSHVFLDKAAQGFRGGDFVVGLGAYRSGIAPGKCRKWAAPQFTLAYYPGEKREDSFLVMERLFGVLEALPVPGNLLLGGEIGSCTIGEGILRIQVGYEYLVTSNMPGEAMGSLKLDTKKI